MNEIEFWRVVETLDGSADSEAVDRLIEVLQAYPPMEIRAFDGLLWSAVRRLQDSRGFARYADAMEVKGDEELFLALAFVARGVDVYNKMLSDAPLDQVDSVSMLGGDLLAFAATEAFERVTGELLTPQSFTETPNAGHLSWISLQFGESELKPRLLWEPMFDHQAKRAAASPKWLEWRDRWNVSELWVFLQYQHKAPGERLRVGLDGSVVTADLRTRASRLPRFPTPRVVKEESARVLEQVASRVETQRRAEG